MTIFDNTSAFGLMDKALKDEMRAWPHGHLIYSAQGTWMTYAPKWGIGHIYRAIPAPLTKPSVDWAILSDKIAGIARDENGLIYAFLEKPCLGATVWSSDENYWQLHPELLPSVTPGTCDWRDSWVPNPRYKP